MRDWMTMRGVFALYRARLRARSVVVQELFAVLGIAVGVALLFSSQVAGTSLTRSISELGRQVIGSNEKWQLDARGPDGFDERLLTQVRDLSGVTSALPVLERQANVIGPRGQRAVDLVGTDPRFAHAGGPLLRRFSAAQLIGQRAIALPAPLAGAIGAGALQVIDIQIGASEVRTLLGATLQASDIGGLVHSPIALAPVGYVQNVAGMRGRITRIFVSPAPGKDALVHHELSALASRTNLDLEPAGFDSTLFATAVAPEGKSEALFSAISALVGFMFALNAMLITVPGRRELIKRIGPHGTNKAKIVQVLAFDAAVIGVAACVIGLALGELLSLEVFRVTPGYLSFAFPVGNDRIVTLQSVLLAASAGIVAAFAGVFWPLRESFLDARPRTRPPRAVSIRILGGAACLIATTVLLIAAPGAAVVGNVLLVAGMVCLLPYMFNAIVGVFARAQSRFGGAATKLAVVELDVPQIRVRSLAIATTAAVAVFGIVEFQGTQANLTRGLQTSAKGIDSTAQVWVTPAGESNAFATTPFSTARAGILTRLPGVTVGIYRGSFLNWGKRRLWVLAQPPSIRDPVPSGQLLKGAQALADQRIDQGGWVVLSQALAREHHLRIGDRAQLPSPRPASLRVAGLSTNLGWPPGAIVMNATDYEHAWGSADPSALQLDGHTSPQSIRQETIRALGPASGLQVETAHERESRHYALAAQGLSRLTQIRLLVLIAAVLAVSGALGAMIWQRRDLVAFIKCGGYPRNVLLRWLTYESAILLAAGSAVGAAFGVCAQLLGSHFLASVTGFPIVFDIQAVAALSSFFIVIAVAVGIVLVPGYLVVCVPARTTSPTY